MRDCRRFQSRRIRYAIFAACFFLSLIIFPIQSRATSFGDAVLTVGISSAVGAVLGLSTLPFYDNSGVHTKNIWIGAAIGAVIGVGVAAFSAISTTDATDFQEDYQDASKKDFTLLRLNHRLRRPTSLGTAPLLLETNAGKLAPASPFANDKFVLWAPVKTIYF